MLLLNIFVLLYNIHGTIWSKNGSKFKQEASFANRIPTARRREEKKKLPQYIPMAFAHRQNHLAARTVGSIYVV